MSSSPAVSVIVPTHNRGAMLAASLAALDRQSWPKDNFEVVVVADDCNDGTEKLVRDIARHAPYSLRSYNHKARSAAAGRNLGASNARGAVLLFLDDDVLSEPELMRAHMDAQSQDRVVFGYSKPAITEKASWWQRNARLWWEDAYTAMRRADHRYNYRDCFSGNMSLSADLFNRAGGFDTSMTGRLEDYELGLRLLEAGARFCFAPEAIGYHHDHTDLALWLRRLRQEGIADVQIGERHPELRTQLFAEYAGLTEPRDRLRRMIRKIAFSSPQCAYWIESFLLSLAAFCERMRLRGSWLHITGALREYYYWAGVASSFQGRTMLTSWLQEAPMPPPLAENAPLVDIAALPETEVLREVLARADKLGLRLAVGGVEVLTIPPQPGSESLRQEHLWGALRELARTQFIPALGLKMIQSLEGRGIPCSSSFVS